METLTYDLSLRSSGTSSRGERLRPRSGSSFSDSDLEWARLGRAICAFVGALESAMARRDVLELVLSNGPYGYEMLSSAESVGVTDAGVGAGASVVG